MKRHKPKRMFGKDTINYSLAWEVNENYEQEMEYWKEDPVQIWRGGGWVDDLPQDKYCKFKLIINEEIVNVFTDPYELISVTTQSKCYGRKYWYPNNDYDSEVSYPDNERKYSDFYPFTCSCGVAGCNGIFDGVHLKVRGRSVEWRVKKNMGYNFLDKTFYQFDKQDYFDMIEKIKGELCAIKNTLP